jgi:hypothetical protein
MWQVIVVPAPESVILPGVKVLKPGVFHVTIAEQDVKPAVMA